MNQGHLCAGRRPQMAREPLATAVQPGLDVRDREVRAAHVEKGGDAGLVVSSQMCTGSMMQVQTL